MNNVTSNASHKLSLPAIAPLVRGDCSENDDHNGECGQNPVRDDESRTPPNRADERSPTDPCEPFKRIELSTVCEIEADDVLVKNSD